MAAFAATCGTLCTRNRAGIHSIVPVRPKYRATPTRVRATSVYRANSKEGSAPRITPSPKLRRGLKVLRQFALLTWPLLVAALFMCVVESWPIVDGLYFATTVATTVGYGDLAPATPAGRAFVAVYALFCAARLGAVLGRAVDAAASAVASDGAHDGDAERSALRRVRATAVFLCVVLLLGCVLYARTLSLPLVDALYFVAVSASTVGLGDLSPQTPAGRLFATMWLVFAALGLANMLSRYAEWRAAVARRHSLDALTASFNRRAFRAMDQDGDDRLTQAEFLGYVFCKLGVVSQSEVRHILKRFDSIDANASGTIDLQEVMAIESEAARNRQLAPIEQTKHSSLRR